MTTPLKLTCKVRFTRAGKGGGKDLRVRTDPPPTSARVPRLTRLIALAIKLDRRIRDGELKDQAQVARLGGVTRARVTQIMNLLSLAPDLQESLLSLSPVERGRAPIVLRDVQPIAQMLDWRVQRRMWRKLFKRACEK
jgi:hypothetical protein